MQNLKLQLSDRISQADPRLSPADRRIADYLLRTFPAGLLENVSTIAKAVDLNISTVSRFFPKIGYESIKGAHADVRRSMDFLMDPPLMRAPEGVRSVKDDHALLQRILHLELQNVQTTFRDLVIADVRKVMRLLADDQRSVYLFGTRKHFALCYYTFIQLTGVRENVFLASTENLYVADLLTRVRPKDILWLFDFRRYPRLSGKVAEYCKQAGAQMILFTDSLMAPQVPLADVTFIVATRGVSAFDSYTAGTARINALLAEYFRLAADSLQARYAIQEKLLRHFDIFVPHRSPGDGRRSAVRQRMTRGNATPARPASGGMR